MARRSDATRVKVDDPFHMIVPYVMPNRTQAEVSYTEHFDITKLVKYIETKNKGLKKNDEKLKLFHCICYATAKTIYHRPLMNRFIKGKYFWQRNDITLSFVAKQQFSDGAEEKLMLLKVEPNMTVKDISRIIVGDVSKARKENSNDLDKTMRIVGSLPRFVKTIIFWVVNKMDFYGIMPSSLMKGDPNYSTVLLSNLGSIGAKSAYHHLSEYGTNSVMMTIGTMKNDTKTKIGLDITYNFDERIADGFYFAKSLRYMKYCFENPKAMEKVISETFPEGII